MKALKPIVLSLSLFMSAFSGTVNAEGQCTPPGMRPYYQEWTLSTIQSLFHKCALGGLVDFKTLSIFDPTQALLNLIKAKACNILREKTQPFRDDLNSKIDAINAQIDQFNNAQNVNQWVEPNGSGFSSPLSNDIQNVPGITLIPSHAGVTLSVDNNSIKGALNNGTNLDSAGKTTNPVSTYVPPENTQNNTGNTANGLMDRGGATGVPRFPLPAPKDWTSIYKGVVGN